MFYCFIFFISILYVVQGVEEVSVQSPVGEIVGTAITLNYGGSRYSVTQFLGIPFAESTDGPRRFAKPVKKPPFTSRYFANTALPFCPQGVGGTDKSNMNDDCLHLNIYVPGKPSSSNSLAVMIWIYGGGFQIGSQNGYQSPPFAAVNNVIYVTINYRLGLFGFLANSDEGLSGNYGLWDQHMAIQWVHDNIRAFGGDTNNVTIFGESAGSASVIYQALYPGNDGLFQRVIAESGSPLCPWAFTDAPGLLFEELLKKTNCLPEQTNDIMACLRTLSTEYLLQVAAPEYLPVVDGDFLKIAPSELWNNPKHPEALNVLHHFGNIDLILGINSYDGAMWSSLPADSDDRGITYEEFEAFIPYYISSFTGRFTGNTSSLMIDSVMHQYTDWSDPNNPFTTRQMYLDMVKDTMFTTCITTMAKVHAQANGTGSSYLFEFDHRPSFSTNPAWVRGANHGDEIVFVLGLIGYLPMEVTLEEITLSLTMMNIWTRFAKTGNPNEISDSSVTEWPVYDLEQQQYLVFNTNITSLPVMNHIRADAVHFWNHLFPLIDDISSADDRCDNKTDSGGNETNTDETGNNGNVTDTDPNIGIKENITVSTTVGDIVGTVKNITHNKLHYRVSEFLGIPFAESTSGENRFAKPVKKEAFSTPYVANQRTRFCVQMMMYVSGPDDMSEDCLHLDVIVPGKASASNKHAVMIWIHGGGFQRGLKDLYTSRSFSALNDVILVTINYRVGPFGFLANPGNGLHGNNGLWDQHMAIQWVHDNIAAFGGDTNRVTLFGQSAGASSVIYQALYEGNKGLIQRVIVESGPFILNRKPEEMYKKLLERTSCKYAMKSMVNQCLRDLNPAQIYSVQIYDGIFEPFLDNDFFKETPEDIFDGKTGNTENLSILKQFGDLDVIFGVNSDDGGMFLFNLPRSINMTTGLTRSEFETAVGTLYGEYGQFKTDFEKQAIIYQYTDWSDPEDVITARQMLINTLTDSLFAARAASAIRAHNEIKGSGNIYFYEYDHRPSFSLSPAYVKGGYHGDEVAFVLGFPPALMSSYGQTHLDPASLLPEEEVDLSNKMMSYWAQYAKSGNPNPYNQYSWPANYLTSQQYIVFQANKTPLPVRHNYRAENVRFWNHLLPSLADAVTESERTCPNNISNASSIYWSSLPVLILCFVLKSLLIFGNM